MKRLSVVSVLIRLEGGGAERSVERIVAPLEKRGITLVRYAIDGPWPGEIGDSRRTLTERPSRGAKRILTAALRLAEIIRIDRPHVVHLHCEAPELVGLIARVLTLRARYSLVVTDHSMKSWSGVRAPFGAAIRWLLRRFGAVYVNCFTASNSKANIPVVLNPSATIGELAPRDTSPPRLVVIGRVIESKRIDQVLRAAHMCSWPGEVVVIGAGAAQRSLQILADDLGLDVTFHGHQSDPWSLVREQDIFVTASAFEGEPLTLIEALQHNLSILASNIPAHVKVLERHRGIFTDAVSLSKMLSSCCESEPIEDQYKVDPILLQRILDKRNPNRIAREWEKIYRDVTKAWISSGE